MKIYLILVFALCFASDLISQNFLDTNNQWNVVVGPGFLGPNEYTNIYQIGGDSTINGQTYTKINVAIDTSSTHIRLQGLYRETADNKVFYLRNGNEQLIFDPNWQLNDTVVYGSFNCRAVVTNVDSVSMLNGEQRKRFTIQDVSGNPNFATTDTLIQGIGSLNNPFSHGALCITDQSTSLICYSSENETLLFRNFRDQNGCIIVSTKDFAKIDKVLLYPNPAENWIQISNETNQVFDSYLIYNQLGQVLRAIRATSNTIDISVLASGRYTLVGKFEGQSYVLGSFFKG